LEATGAEVLHLSADGLNLVACKIVYSGVIGRQVFVTKTFSNNYFLCIVLKTCNLVVKSPSYIGKWRSTTSVTTLDNIAKFKTWLQILIR
jgi:hypothetical protein